ncbi:hypothetical protein CP8484711_1623, partial [Chlamydia psittaci 84-8471/1]
RTPPCHTTTNGTAYHC